MKNHTMKKIVGALLGLVFLFAFTQCSDDENNATSGKLSMSITDAPIDDENVASVILTFQKIEVHSESEGWITLEQFDEPVSIDLLAYQNGESYFLTEEVIPAGDYNQIRLVLDMEQTGTYILYDDGSKQQLKVPSGSQSGYKINGDFTVPAGGVVNLTLDWDLRRAIVKAGNSGLYILKPTVRVIVNEDAAMIRGTVVDNIGLEQIAVFAYTDDTFADSEYVGVAEGETMFPNAVTSAMVNDQDAFTLAFLNSGIYDLYFVEYDIDGNFVRLAGSEHDIVLDAGEIENVEVTLEE